MTICARVTGDFALFTNPMTKTGGEKCSYLLPTYEACRGIIESVYFKPSIYWVIDRLRIIKPIQLETKSVKLSNIYGDKQQLAYYTYLRDVEYEIEAHFEFATWRKHLASDFNSGKHIAIAKRSLERGGRRDIFLGTRECQANVEPCIFGEKPSYYDGTEKEFGFMFHRYVFNEEDVDVYGAQIQMNNGIIDYRHVEEVHLNTLPNFAGNRHFVLGENMKAVKEE